jgi:hypothetical protein
LTGIKAGLRAGVKIAGIGSYLIAVPYASLPSSDEAKGIVLPGAAKEHVKALPEVQLPIDQSGST